MSAAEVREPDEAREDLASYGPAADGAAALLERETELDEQAFLAAVRRFSDSQLPSRGWERVLEVGAGAGTRAIVLAERGYALTVVEPDELRMRFVRHRFARRGLEATFLQVAAIDEIPGTFDAAFCFDPAALALEADAAAAVLRRCLRAHALLIGGPSFSSVDPDALVSRGFALVPDGDGDVITLRVRGSIGRMLARSSSLR
jgi:SAM-dependent methyltransferase